MDFDLSDIQSNKYSLELRNLEETILFGEKFITQIPELNLVFLKGKLGAGKTSLVKGIALGLEIYEPITSPTFPLAQHYESNKRHLIHLDLYRLDNPMEANELFLQEEEEAIAIDAVLVVEWPERLNLLINEAWEIKFNHTSRNTRIVKIQTPDLHLRNSLT